MPRTMMNHTSGIHLERISEFRTRLIYGNLDDAAKAALRLLKKASVGARCKWTTDEEWETVEQGRAELGLHTSRSIILRGPLAAIARFLRRHLQPERSVLMEVTFADGQIIECHESSYDTCKNKEEETPKPSSTWRPVVG